MRQRSRTDFAATLVAAAAALAVLSPWPAAAQAPLAQGARSWQSPAPPQYRPPAEPERRGFLGLLFGARPPAPAPAPAPAEETLAAPGRDAEYGFPVLSQGTYRTMCVRLCDGYYWPISHATTRAGFAGDSARCAASCDAPARLFVHRSPGGDVAQMVDLSGRRYADLPAAFRYRKEYAADCQCAPEPWSEAAQAAYRAREATELPPEPGARDGAPALAAAEPRPLPQPASAAPPARYWSAPPRGEPRYDTHPAAARRGLLSGFFFNR